MGNTFSEGRTQVFPFSEESGCLETPGEEVERFEFWLGESALLFCLMLPLSISQLTVFLERGSESEDIAIGCRSLSAAR